MCDEKSITGYDPANGSYVVKDHYELTNEGILEFQNAEIPFSSAKFMLIRSFEVQNKDSQDKIKQKNVLIEGHFTVQLNPKQAPLARGYTTGVSFDQLDVEQVRKLYQGASFNTGDLLGLPLPTIAIKGKFKHLVSGKRYDIAIENVFVTQDFPGAFYRHPLEEATYSFIATDVTIKPL